MPEPAYSRRPSERTVTGSPAFAAGQAVAAQYATSHSVFGHDPERITPLTKSYILGRDYEQPETHVAGLRQHSGSAVVGVLRSQGACSTRSPTRRRRRSRPLTHAAPRGHPHL